MSTFDRNGNNHMSVEDAEIAFSAAMADKGYGLHDIPADGVWHGFAFPDNSSGHQSGRAKLTVNGSGAPDGVVIDFRNGKSPILVWQPDARVEVDDAHRERMRAAAAEKKAARERARIDALNLFATLPEAGADHPYLVSKKITNPYPLKLDGDKLVVPIYDARTGELQTIQYISPDGDKMFPTDATVAGGCAMPGSYMLDKLKRHPRSDEPFVIAEGWATAYAIHSATFYPTIAALSCWNLEAVARAMRDRDPLRKIIIAADDETKKEEGRTDHPGIDNALDAARAVDGLVAYPSRGDFNDVFVEDGEQLVKEQIDAAEEVPEEVPVADETADSSSGLLSEMNERHCVLPIGGKTRVATWGEDPMFPGRRGILRTSSFGDFKALHDKYRHTYVDSDGEIQNTRRGTWWLGNPGRRQYDGGMRFMPDRDERVVGDTLNLWEGFAVVPRKPEGKSGKDGCKLFLDHGLKIICGGNEEHFDYMMKREAFIAQQRTRCEVALALRTKEEGTGKGFWTRTLNRLYGVHAMQVQNPEHVIGKHNAHLENLLRLTADEALFVGDPRHRNALFGLITEPTITIEPKFVDKYVVDNFVNLDILSNADHFIVVSGTARRFFHPTTSPERAGDHEYFRKIDEELCNGGYEALLYHLLHEIKLDGFNVRAVPKTAALREQAAYSRKGVDLLVETACNEACVPCAIDDHPHVSRVTGRNHHHSPGFDYFIEHHKDRELSYMSPLMVKRRLVKEWGCVTGKEARKQEDGKQVSGILWPPLADLRARFEARFGPQEWQSSETEWQPETW